MYTDKMMNGEESYHMYTSIKGKEGKEPWNTKDHEQFSFAFHTRHEHIPSRPTSKHKDQNHYVFMSLFSLIRSAVDGRTSGNHQSCIQNNNLTSAQFFFTPQKLGESIRRSRAGSEVSRDIVFVRSSESTENSLLPTEKLADAHASMHCGRC